MALEKIHIEDVEEGDILWVDNENCWMMVKYVTARFSKGITLIFEGVYQELVRHYTKRKTFYLM